MACCGFVVCLKACFLRFEAHSEPVHKINALFCVFLSDAGRGNSDEENKTLTA